MAKLEAIRAFVVVAQHGNLRDAAAELGRTQSALSMALAQLEQALGGPLFETDRKRDLTDLGQFVRDTGAELIREHDRVQNLIYGYASGRVGHLRIAAVPSVAALILPDLLCRFMDTHDGAHIDVMDSDSTNVRTMVASGLVDVGIAGPAPAGQTLRADPLFNDRMHVVCHRDSPLAQTDQGLTWHSLSQAELISNETLLALDAPEATSVIARSKMSVRNVSSLLAMIESGMGITVLPGLATLSLSDTLCALPLSGASSTRAISLLSRDGRVQSPLTAAFRSDLARIMPDIIAKFELKDSDPVSSTQA